MGFRTKGYYIYWGTDSNGQATNYKTGNTFNASNTISTSSIWYLRMQTTDGQNLGPWTTIYIFKYDIELPTNPDFVYSNSHKINVRNDDNTIEVSWSTPSDEYSQVAGYCAIWSTSTSYTSDLVLNCTTDTIISPVLANGTWYFFLYAVDNAGNWVASGKRIGPFIIGSIPKTPDPPASDPPTDTSGSDDDSNDNSIMIIIYSVVGGASVVAIGLMLKIRAKNHAKKIVTKELEKISKVTPQPNIITKPKVEGTIVSKEIPIKDLTPATSTNQAKINLGLEKNIGDNDLDDFLNMKVEDVQSKAKPKPESK